MDTIVVKERPIIFGSDSVRTILAGKKTQTRRVVKPQSPRGVYNLGGKGRWFTTRDEYGTDHGPYTCPYDKPGDRLYVKETFFYATGSVDGGPDLIHYKATAADDLPQIAKDHKLWISPLFMPKEASRIALEVTEIRVERLQEISHRDALAEGVEYDVSRSDGAPLPRFQKHWDALNPKRGYAWESNPWVWVISFKRLAT